MPSEPTRTLLRGGTVVSVDSALGDFRGDILIEGDVIAAVGDLGDVPGAEVIDVRDHIVFPGFVDGHRHLYQTVLRCLGVDTAALHQAADRAAHDLIERSGISPSWRPSFA